MIDKASLILHVMEQKKASVPELMLRFSLSYQEARSYVANLSKANVIGPVGDMQFELLPSFAATCSRLLQEQGDVLRALLQADETQYRAMYAVYKKGKIRFGEYTANEMRRLKDVLGDDVWEWMVKNRVLNDRYELVMHKDLLFSILTLLATFCGYKR